jgi:hypothetical protein
MPAIAGTLAGRRQGHWVAHLRAVNKTIGNAPKDAAEIVATTPTSTYMLGKTAVTHPEKVPGMLAAPYVELAKHPGKFIQEHPVSAALMVAPARRFPAAARARSATGWQADAEG